MLPPPPPPVSTFSLRLLSHSLPSPIYGGGDWAALFSPTVDYSPFQNARKSLVSFNFAPLTGPRGAVPASAQPYVTVVPSYKIPIPRPTVPQLAVSWGSASPPCKPFLSPFTLPLFPRLPRLPTNVNQFPGQWMDRWHREGRCGQERKEPPSHCL